MQNSQSVPRISPSIFNLTNAGPHTARVDELIKNMSKADGWNIVMKNQPPCSPDFNILDLEFFNCIQSIQSKKLTRTIAELIKAVQDAFYKEQKRETLNNMFLSLQ